MKILIVSQYFYPENFRINDLAYELKKRGHEICVLTGKPNYPQGEYYSGYTYRGNEDEEWNGIPVYRVPLRARKTGAVHLIRNYFSFVIEANKRIVKLKEEYDLIYVFEVSPMTVALPAIKLKKMNQIPVIMNVQDLWPENIIAVTGIDNWFVNFFLNRIVNYIYKNTDLILAASPAFISRITPRIKEKDKVLFWPQYSIVSNEEKQGEEHFQKEKFNIVFTGNIGDAQGLELLIHAAKDLDDTNIVFHLVGDGKNRKKLEYEVSRNQLEDKIIFYGQVPEDKIPGFLSDADAALLILKPNPVFDMTIPAKLQTYLACGCPVLGCVQGVSKQMIDDNALGLTTNEISSKSLADTCRLFAEKSRESKVFSENALLFSKKNFDKEVLVDDLINHMEKLVYGKQESK